MTIPSRSRSRLRQPGTWMSDTLIRRAGLSCHSSPPSRYNAGSGVQGFSPAATDLPFSTRLARPGLPHRSMGRIGAIGSVGGEVNPTKRWTADAQD